MTEEQEHTATFTGYLAQLIELYAERAGKTPQAYILSFFDKRCNAPHGVMSPLLPKDKAALFCH